MSEENCASPDMRRRLLCGGIEKEELTNQSEVATLQ